MGILAAALLLAAPLAAQELAGFYEINQMEMGGGLELRPDGRFRYASNMVRYRKEPRAIGRWTAGPCG